MGDAVLSGLLVLEGAEAWRVTVRAGASGLALTLQRGGVTIEFTGAAAGTDSFLRHIERGGVLIRPPGPLILA